MGFCGVGINWANFVCDIDIQQNNNEARLFHVYPPVYYLELLELLGFY